MAANRPLFRILAHVRTSEVIEISTLCDCVKMGFEFYLSVTNRYLPRLPGIAREAR